MNALITDVARERGLPTWLVESVAIEHTDCRDYAVGEHLWRFNFDKVDAGELHHALDTHRVVVRNVVFHNVRPEVWTARTIRALVGKAVIDPAEEPADIIPEGPISSAHILLASNPIDVWDPKLSLATHFQFLDDEGRIWQWQFADFVSVPGRSYGKWVSDQLDLEPFDEVHPRYVALATRMGLHEAAESRPSPAEIRDFYDWLHHLRTALLAPLPDLHARAAARERRWPKVVDDVVPPLLSHFETFTVRNNAFETKLYAEAIFFRACQKHARRAGELLAQSGTGAALVNALDEVYQERAAAVIAAAACLESFINGLGYEHLGRIWEDTEKLALIAKWRLFLEFRGQGDKFDTKQPPYQILNDITQSRNFLVHHKRKYEPVKLLNRNVATSQIGVRLSDALVRRLAERVEGSITALCHHAGIPEPKWLAEKASWLP